MTSNRYVVLNCPALESNRVCFSKVMKQCADRTDCLLKRIVELAKGYKEELIDRKTKKVVATRYFKLTKEILELLDIQECENE